jgi:hypothetical protein
MSQSVYLTENHTSIAKPFSLRVRTFEGIEVEWRCITDLTANDAKLLTKECIPWKDNEPDWDKHNNRIAIMMAERDKAAAEKRLAELRRQS